MAAQAQARLLLDVRQNHHHALPAAGRAAAKGPQPARAGIHHPAQPVDLESPALFLDKPKPHGVGHSPGPMASMPSMARKGLGGFFRMSHFRRDNSPPDCYPIRLKSFKRQISRRSRSLAPARGSRPGPHPCRDVRSPVCSRPTSRPPDHPQPEPRKPAGQRDPHRTLVKFTRPAGAHASSPLPHIMLPKKRHQTATGPLREIRGVEPTQAGVETGFIHATDGQDVVAGDGPNLPNFDVHPSEREPAAPLCFIPRGKIWKLVTMGP